MHLIIFRQSKVVIGGKYIFVLITVLHAWPIALISTSVSQKITLNNVQNRRVLVYVYDDQGLLLTYRPNIRARNLIRA